MMRSLVVAFPRTIRAVPLRTLGVVGLVAVAPTVITVARSGTDVRFALVTAAVLGGAGLAYALDDDADVLLAASPTSLAERRGARLVAALVLVAVSWGAALLVAASAGLLVEARVTDLAVEALVAAGLAAGVAAALHRELGVEHPGLAGAAVGVTGVLFVAMLSMRYPWLPRLGDPQGHGKWLWIALVGWAMVCWASRDPAGQAPGRHRR